MCGRHGWEIKTGTWISNESGTQYWKLKDGGDIEEIKPQTSKSDGPTAADAIIGGMGVVASSMDKGFDLAKRTGEVMAETNADGTINIVEKANDLGKSGKILEKTFKKIGIAGSVYDAVNAGIDMVDTYQNPNATVGDKVGATAKFLFKSVMTFARVNPIVNVALTVADLSGITDKAFSGW